MPTYRKQNSPPPKTPNTPAQQPPPFQNLLSPAERVARRCAPDKAKKPRQAGASKGGFPQAGNQQGTALRAFGGGTGPLDPGTPAARAPGQQG
ncbi:hypothetical protein GCM10010496_72660 [Streptomyces asoensis]|nr:hypothetical protein GCM10010496_72660 [Streptomyces asoensis]